MANFRADLVKILLEYECYFVRYGKGDHEIWHSPKTKKNIAVDYNIHSLHTADKILKDAGIERKFKENGKQHTGKKDRGDDARSR